MKNLPSNETSGSANPVSSKRMKLDDLSVEANKKYLPYEVLLDYANGDLSDIEKQIADELISETPEDRYVIEGIQLFKENEGMSDAQIEAFLIDGASDTKFLTNRKTKPSQKKRRRLGLVQLLKSLFLCTFILSDFHSNSYLQNSSFEARDLYFLNFKNDESGGKELSDLTTLAEDESLEGQKKKLKDQLDSEKQNSSKRFLEINDSQGSSSLSDSLDTDLKPTMMETSIEDSKEFEDRASNEGTLSEEDSILNALGIDFLKETNEAGENHTQASINVNPLCHKSDNKKHGKANKMFMQKLGNLQQGNSHERYITGNIERATKEDSINLNESLVQAKSGFESKSTKFEIKPIPVRNKIFISGKFAQNTTIFVVGTDGSRSENKVVSNLTQCEIEFPLNPNVIYTVCIFSEFNKETWRFRV